MANETKPRGYVIGTGGTISFIGSKRTDYTNYAYDRRHFTIQELLDRVPEVNEIAEIRAEQFLNVGSPDVGPAHWLALAQRVNQIFNEDPQAAGVAITHGTATLEETGYFLNLTVKSRKPVVVTGSMRPPTGLGTDADVNLIDCVRVAAAPQSAGHGVLTVLNNEIQAARDVTKTNSFRLETFRSNELGLLGYVDSDEATVFYRTTTKPHTLDAEFDVGAVTSLPRVDIAFAYAGADGLTVNAMADARVAGIVAAGLGSGGSPREFMSATLAAREAGIPAVIATQAGAGRVVATRRFLDDGYIVADNLAPKKARILLKLALTKTSDADEIQRMMQTY